MNATITPIRPVCASDAPHATIAAESSNPTCGESERRTRDLRARDRPAISMIVTARYRDYERIVAGLGPDWPEETRWFANFEIAREWLTRCNERGTPLMVRWLVR